MIWKRFVKHWWIIPSAAVAVFLVCIVQWPFVIQAPCYFTAVEEWEVIQTNPSRFLSRVRQNEWMKISSYTYLQFDREDFIQCSLDPDLRPGQTVAADRVLGEIISSVNQLQLVGLQGQLKKARANLTMIQTGEKDAVQREALESLKYAKTQYDAFLPEFERSKKLHEQKLISEEEWDQAQKTENLLRQNISVQDAKLKVVQSGEKEESVRMVEEDVGRLEAEVRQLENKISLGKIQTPIAGVFSYSSQDSVLCRVSRLDSVVCTILVRSDQIPFIRGGQTVVARNAETDFRKTGTVAAKDQKSTMVSGRPVFMVTACFENSGGKILPGMIGQAAIFTDRVSLWEIIRRAWNRRADQIYL